MSIEFHGRKVDAVVLDFNGTFYIPNKEFQKKVWKDARLQLVQKTFDAEGRTSVKGIVFGRRLQDFVDEALENGWRVTFNKYGGKNEDFDSIINSVPLSEFLQFDQEITNFIQELITHVPVYLFSSSQIDRVLRCLEAVVGDLAHEMENKILSGDRMQTARKPSPDAYKEMISRLGINPETTVYADNNWREADVAAKLGMMTFLVDAAGEGIMNDHVVINSLVGMREHLKITQDAI